MPLIEHPKVTVKITVTVENARPSHRRPRMQYEQACTFEPHGGLIGEELPAYVVDAVRQTADVMRPVWTVAL